MFVLYLYLLSPSNPTREVKQQSYKNPGYATAPNGNLVQKKKAVQFQLPSDRSTNGC